MLYVANNQLTGQVGADKRHVSLWPMRDPGLSNSARQSWQPCWEKIFEQIPLGKGPKT